MKTYEAQAAADLNYQKQMYPIVQAAAWDATKRGIYGDKYSASAAQRRAAESAGAEAQMLAGIASQANAAANMRGRYAGRNISIS
jgi:precorrin-4 methylase